MKKAFYILGVLLFLALCGIGMYYIENYEDIYYSKIDNTKIEKLESGDMKYEYTLDCYNESGKKKEIKFKTSRELKQDAYIKLIVRISGVHAWEEVSFEQLPNKVKEKYK